MSRELQAPEPHAVRLVLCTVPTAEAGAVIARTLVEERLVACVNLVPGVTSIYRWQGKVEEAQEMLLLCKTTRDRIPALLARIPELHSYDVPEALVVDVDGGLPPYLAWLADATARIVS